MHNLNTSHISHRRRSSVPLLLTLLVASSSCCMGKHALSHSNRSSIRFRSLIEGNIAVRAVVAVDPTTSASSSILPIYRHGWHRYNGSLQRTLHLCRGGGGEPAEVHVQDDEVDSFDDKTSIDVNFVGDDDVLFDHDADAERYESTPSVSSVGSSSSVQDDRLQMELTEEQYQTTQINIDGEFDLSEIVDKRIQELRDAASQQRSEGKIYHDDGNVKDAALAFHEAASYLDDAMALKVANRDVEDEDDIVMELATCRLHEALCLFKDGHPDDCIRVCTSVLGDKITTFHAEEVARATSDSDMTKTVQHGNEYQLADASVSINSSSPTVYEHTIPSQIRARAHHRRAKARLAVGDLDGALEDARTAAFMGDQNAVTYYGRLMREGTGANDSGRETGGRGDWRDLLEGGSSRNPFLEGVLEGLTGSNSENSAIGASGIANNPLSIIGELFDPPPESGDGRSKLRRYKHDKDSLAQSVLSNLMKRVEDEGTQTKICRYLHSIKKQQIMQFALMAGVPMNEQSAQRLISFALAVTPKGISRSISNVKRVYSVFKTLRKLLKVIDKYKQFIVIIVICYWIKSAIVEPYRIDKSRSKEIAQKVGMTFVIT